ncbi:hypothetical protein [Spirosoma radiotolerans]|uniref:Uncharacterized protein n=1 Tax=Spirosoma radiotolerans TaxID=1379870 RepID=A0A0E3ZW70_9BACT|nr:hypothetical protein [Spirosoma radiotolerans]AKD56473.1 hypothetical protein SD10_17735 [Spirosoma radiotolerans]
MKTSHILLALITMVTLTGMVATDLLLKEQYDKIDWRNTYQDFKKQDLPTARHWVVTGTPTSEVIVEKTVSKPQALIAPEEVKFYRVRRQGDTAFVSFTPDYSGYRSSPQDDAGRELGIQLVLRLPGFQTLTVENARLTLSGLSTDSLTVSLAQSRLRTHNVAVSAQFKLKVTQNSFAMLGNDQYKLLQAVVADSSGMQLNDSRVDAFTKNISPKAGIQLEGQALKWLK